MFWYFLGVALVAIGIFWISAYNTFIEMRNVCNNTFKDVEVQLRMRYDMIPMLVNCVKGYAAHETKTLQAVMRARNAGLNAEGVEECFKAARRMDRSLHNLYAVSERYPDLKADKGFQQLFASISVTEFYIAEARKAYNNAVRDYNDMVMQFPSRIVALRHNFQPNYTDVLPPENRAELNTPPKLEF